MLIFISCMENRTYRGWGKNGGIKLYSLWANLLNANGHEAYIVTWDGNAEPWLVNPPAVISRQQMLNMIEKYKLEHKSHLLRFLTGWLAAEEFINIALAAVGHFYFFDAEPAYTINSEIYGNNVYDSSHYHLYLKYAPVMKIATHTQRGQMLHNLQLGTDNVGYIREWSDQEVFYPRDKQPLIGYTDEDTVNMPRILEGIREALSLSRSNYDLIEVKGDEAAFAELLGRCEFFLGLNYGKHSLIGEGCPRVHQEALHSGCCVLAKDVGGNQEYLADGLTGKLYSTHQDLIDNLPYMLEQKKYAQNLAYNGYNLVSLLFTKHDKYPLVADFLDLRGKHLW